MYVAGLFASYLLERRAGLPNEHPTDDVVLQVGFGAFAVVGALLAARRPANAVGWIIAAVAPMVAVFHTGDSYAAYVMVTRGRPDALAVVSAWIGNWYWYVLLVLVVIYLPLFFPDGRLPSRRWLPIAVLPAIATLGIVVFGALVDTLAVNEAPGYEIANPIGIRGLDRAEDLPVFGVLNGLLLVGAVGAGASVVVRFRRSREIERQQMKWFLYVASFILLAPVVSRLPDIVNGIWFDLVLVALPADIGIAVLRRRLYDIDLIINRTLVYGVLSLLLGPIYFGAIVLSQTVLRALTGGVSSLAVVASTLTIAALFNPLRQRIQNFIDRRFYQKRYDAAKTLEAFSASLREETDLGELNDHLLAVVRETMQPEHVSLWMHHPGDLERSERGPRGV